MIYDCFIFFNELELLELRLHELAEVVDKFVLVEATQTHSNQAKPLYYHENRSRFNAFQNKIVHVVVEDLPKADNPWVPENFHRNCIARGLAHCQPNDWILISDVDEIPRAETVKQVSRNYAYPDSVWTNAILRPAISVLLAWKFSRGRVRRHHPFIFKFEQSKHRHFINCVTVNPPSSIYWHGTRMLFYRDFTSAQEIRHSGHRVIKDGGWHFTSMGGAERIVEKVKAFAHQEFNQSAFLDVNRIQETISQGKSLFDPEEELKFVPMDASYPRYILEHPEKFSSWIKPV